MRQLPGRSKTAFLICLLALQCLALFRGEAPGAETLPFTFKEESRPAPDFTLKDLGGLSHSLEGYRGSVVLLHFWASWCVPCKTEFPAINKLWKELGGKDLVILGVAEDSAERVAPFVKDYGVEFPVLIDQYGGVMRSYGVSVIPVSVVIDRAGVVRAVFVGPRDYGSPDAKRFFRDISR